MSISKCGRRTGRLRHACTGVAAALALQVGAAQGHCLDAYVHADPRPALEVAGSGGLKMRVHVSRAHASRTASEPADATVPDDLHQHVLETIQARDLRAFRQALPADPRERSDFIERNASLQSALYFGAADIVRQILAWNPQAIARLSYKEQLLDEQGWRWAGERARSEGSDEGEVVDRPSDEDRLYLVKTLLDGGAQDKYETLLAAVAAMKADAQTGEALRLLIAHHASGDAGPSDRASAGLAAAAAAANVDLFCALLAKGRPNQATLDLALTRTPLQDDNPIAWYLIDQGADVNARDRHFAPVQTLAWAVSHDPKSRHGGVALLRRFIERGAEPDRMETPTGTALEQVAGDLGLMTSLLARGADPNQADFDGDTPLLLTLSPALTQPEERRRLSPAARLRPLDRAERRAAVALLLEHGADPNRANKTGVTPLMQTDGEDDDIVALLLAHGAKLAVPADLAYGTDGRPRSEVGWAIERQRGALALAFLDRDKALPPDARRLFMDAADLNEVRVLDRLVKLGLDPYERRFRDAEMTPLASAARHGAVDSVRFMLDHHIGRIDERMPTQRGLYFIGRYGGTTPLFEAVRGGQLETARLLLARGADPYLKDAQGRSPASIAAQDEHMRELFAGPGVPQAER